MKRMYFGNKEFMTWVPCPAIDAGVGKVGWSTAGGFLNGGRYVRRSTTAAKVYNFTWNLASAEAIHGVLDFADGVYGDGPFYFLDPFAVDSNLMPLYWSAPRLGAKDGPPLIKDKRPDLVATAANTLGYPTKSAVYSLTAGDEFISLWFPVPPGYTFHIGVHGSSTGTARITVTPDGGVAQDVTMLPVNSSERTNHEVSGTSGVTFSLAGEGLLTLAGIMVQVLPTGDTVPHGGFISGRGHSGCDFEGDTTVNGYSAALDKKGATAVLAEVGAWL